MKAKFPAEHDDNDDELDLSACGGVAILVLISDALRFFEATMGGLPNSPVLLFPGFILGVLVVSSNACDVLVVWARGEKSIVSLSGERFDCDSDSEGNRECGVFLF